MIAIGSVLAAAAFATLGLGGTVPAAAPHVATDAAGPLNPATARIAASAQVPVGVRVVRLRVSLPKGTTVALGPIQPVQPGPVTLRWNGRRGVGAEGRPAPDGRYVLNVETVGERRLATTPSEVLVDRTPPRITASEPTPAIPAVGAPRVDLRVRDRDWGRGDPVQVRAIVRTRQGRTLAAGAWRDAGPSLALPSKVVRSGRSGPVWVTVQGRDAAGNRGAAPAAPVALPGSPGAPRVMTHVVTRKRLVALTIDDGYDASAMSSMVDTATRMKAPLMFCVNARVLGAYGAALRAKLRRAVRAGWVQACSHGYSHNTGTGTSQAAARADLVQNVGWDRLLGQSTIPFYRPPYGAVGPGILAAARELGYRDVLLWDVDTNDWQHRDAGRTTSVVLGNARAGSIVLMHAIPSSASALPQIISGLRARGLEPAGMGDLLAAGRPSR